MTTAETTMTIEQAQAIIDKHEAEKAKAREKARARAAAYREAHPEARRRAKYATEAEREEARIQKATAWRLANADKVKEYGRRSAERRKAELAAAVAAIEAAKVPAAV